VVSCACAAMAPSWAVAIRARSERDWEREERNIRYVLGWYIGRLARDAGAVRREILNRRREAVTTAGGDGGVGKRKRAAAAALFGIICLLPVGLADLCQST